MPKERLIVLGIIGAPHGVRGQAKVRSFTANPEDITAYGPLKSRDGRTFEITITGGTRDALIASIKGITTREEIEQLRNTELCVPRSALPKPKKGLYYHEDLIGLSLVTKDGKSFGTITAMHNFGAGDLAAVELTSGGEEFVPFSSVTFPDIDIDKGIAVYEPPEIVRE